MLDEKEYIVKVRGFKLQDFVDAREAFFNDEITYETFCKRMAEFATSVMDGHKEVIKRRGGK